MDRSIHDQTERHIINVPMPFTEAQLKMLLTHCNGWENHPEIVNDFYEHIVQEGKVTTSPSASDGDGANIVDIFSYGFMFYMKALCNVDVDPDICWWHPCAHKRPRAIKSIEIEWADRDIVSDENVAFTAIDISTGQIVHAKDVEP